MRTSTKAIFAALLVGASLTSVRIAMASEETKIETPATPDIAAMPMHQQMHGMHERMKNLHAARNPQERQALMREHMASMQGMMKMMHGMMAGQSEQGGGHGHGRRDSASGPCADDGRMGKLEQRMNMMQLMMDQMLKSRMAEIDKE